MEESTVVEKSRKPGSQPKQKPVWYKIETESGSIVYSKGKSPVDAIRRYCKIYDCKEKLKAAREVHHIPREFKDIKHKWPDNMVTTLPPYSDFHILAKKELIENNKMEFDITCSGAIWKLKLLMETDTEFILVDR